MCASTTKIQKTFAAFGFDIFSTQDLYLSFLCEQYAATQRVGLDLCSLTVHAQCLHPFLCTLHSTHITQCTQCTVHTLHKTHSAENTAFALFLCTVFDQNTPVCFFQGKWIHPWAPPCQCLRPTSTWNPSYSFSLYISKFYVPLSCPFWTSERALEGMCPHVLKWVTKHFDSDLYQRPPSWGPAAKGQADS